MKIEHISRPSPAFELSGETKAKIDDLFGRITSYNEFADSITGLTGKAERLGVGIALCRELQSLFDAIDAEQAPALSEAGAAEVAAVEKANADLVAAGLCTAETVFVYADKISIAPGVRQAKEYAERVRNWPGASDGARSRIEQFIERAGQEYQVVSSMIARRQEAVAV